MSSYADTHHDRSHATLFRAWYDTLSPHAQAKLNDWMLSLGAKIRKDFKFAPETSLEMAEAAIWALAIKDMKQILAVLNSRELVKG